MNVLLNRVEIDREILTVNDGLNYGRFYDRKTDDYEIQLTTFEIIDLIEKEYIETRDEIRIDDEMYKTSSEFKSTKYCSLSELFEQESHFEEIMNSYFHITLLTKLFPPSPKNRYVINSTDSIKIVKNQIYIKGRVFELPKNPS